MAQNQMQVDPAKLRSQAEQIGTIGTNVRNNMQSAKAQVDSLKNIWTGDGASAFQQSFQVILDKCSEGLEVIGRMENALYEAADTYEKNEKSIQQQADKLKKLPTNKMR